MKVPIEELYQRSNFLEKLFAWIGHRSMVGGSSNIDFLPEFRQIREHCFGFI